VIHFLASTRCAISDSTRHVRANIWQLIFVANVRPEGEQK